jgi:hypothetical protein
MLRRKPDFIVPSVNPGEQPYLQRWWLIPKNRFFNIYLHCLSISDDARALHDHKWFNMSLVLKGSYIEVMPDLSKAPTPYVRLFDLPVIRKLRRAGAFVFRGAATAHRLELPIVDGKPQPVWSLFITGPITRDWGFHCAKGWVHEAIFLGTGTAGPGPGCE